MGSTCTGRPNSQCYRPYFQPWSPANWEGRIRTAAPVCSAIRRNLRLGIGKLSAPRLDCFREPHAPRDPMVNRCCAPRLLAGNHGAPATPEAIQEDVAMFGAIQNRISNQIYRLAGWMHGKLGGPVVSKRVGPCILPNVQPRTAVWPSSKLLT
jgi:hypothetical protein